MNESVMNEYIKNVRFAERNAWFDSCVYVRFLMNGHGSLNAFQYDQNLNEIVCRFKRENSKHVLVECSMYEGLRALSVVCMITEA